MGARAGGRLFAALLVLLAPIGLAADEAIVESVQIERFSDVAVGEAVGDGLVWRGGIVMRSDHPDFGGLSGMGFVSPDQDLVFVTDQGHFVSGRLLYDADLRPEGLADVRIEPIRNSSGEPLPTRFSRDAEALAVIYRDGRAAAVRVGFENLTRVADYALDGTRPGGPARVVPIPDWLSQTRTNRSIESVCIAPPASPIAGSTLILTEGVLDAAGNHRGWFLGNRDQGGVTYNASRGLDPTDCAFLPDGDLLVLERGIGIFGFVMALRRVPAGEVRPGAVMDGETLLRASGRDVDNMEALAVHTAPDGETRIVIASDDNFLGWQRNLLLEFALR